MPHPFSLRASLDRSRASPRRRAAGPPVEMHVPFLAPHPPAAKGSLRRAVDEEIEASSAALCRICFESGGELISPCRCKGTQQFVHRSCLDHWRSVREGTAFSHCTTCKAQFHLRVQFLDGDGGRKLRFRPFVARDILLVFLAIQTAIVAIGGAAYRLDKDGLFRNWFADGWGHVLAKHPLPFYYCTGVVLFFALVWILGLILHCLLSPPSDNDFPSLFSNNDFPIFSGSSNRESDSDDDGCACLIIIIIFAIIGVVYAFVAATIAFQRIVQRHYHILAKKELTKEYVVEDLRGGYTPPRMGPRARATLEEAAAYVAAFFCNSYQFI